MKDRISPRWWIVQGLTCTAIAAALLFPFRTTLALHLERWRADSYGGPRLSVWRESLALAAAHPLTGSGPDTFTDQFRRRQSTSLSRAYPEFTQESPHNFLLDGLISQGLSFCLVIAGFIYIVFAPPRFPTGGLPLWIRAAFASTLASLFFISVTISGALMLFVLPGLHVGASIPSGNRHSNERPPSVVRPIAWCLAALLLTASFLYLRKDMAYADLKQAAAGHSFHEMAEAYRRSTDSAFPSAGDDLWCSRQFASIARELGPPDSAAAWQLAIEAAARAEQTGDAHAEAAYQAALLAIGLNRAEPAASALRRAIALAPTWYKPHLLLAQLLRYIGPATAAESEARTALDLAGAMRPTVEAALRPAPVPAH
jgi:hypothetical protein